MLYENLRVLPNGHLAFAGTDTVALAEKYQTPLYLLDENRIREKCRIYREAMTKAFGEASLPLYAGKALCFKELYRILQEEHMGIDVVSSGEIYTAKSVGFPLENAYFHGNNKTESDIAFAMDSGVGYFVCDNPEEFAMLDAEAKKRGILQKILIRVTPGIDAHTHAKITTGMEDSKFGVPIHGGALDLAKNALAMKHLSLEGFHCHIGSQIFEETPFIDTVKIMMGFIKTAKDELNYTTKMLDLGGGIGVPYIESDKKPNIADIIARIGATFDEEVAKLHIEKPCVRMEPGRSIVADAGITLYHVGGVKELPHIRNYVSVDGGMTDNPRYTLYSSPYTVINATHASEKPDYICTVAGRCCESGDILQENVCIKKPMHNDVLAVLTTGAYNYAMSSNYNALPKPPIVMIKDGGERLVVKRQTFEDMIAEQL